MATGQQGFDPDDFFDMRRLDRQREQSLSDRQRMNEERRQDEKRAALDEQRRIQLEANRARLDALMGVVNDDAIEITPEMVEVINNKNMRIMPSGEIVRKTGRDMIQRSNQFRRDLILPNIKPPKKSRKKTTTDKNMSKALRQANQKFRTAKGKLRKGATQAQIMRYAHKLLRRMSK